MSPRLIRFFALVTVVLGLCVSGPAASLAGGPASYPAIHGAAELFADSVVNFSNVQGQNGWYYGFYVFPFRSTDFQQMTEFVSDVWYVSTTDFVTTISASTMHPNGTTTEIHSTPVEHWSVRRWKSPIEGEIIVTGTFAMAGAPVCGDGATGRIIVDGTEAWTQTLQADDTTGVTFNETINVSVNSLVDFAVSPGTASEDYCDEVVFTVQILVESPPVEIPDNGIWGSFDGAVKMYLQKYAAGSVVLVITLGNGYTAFLDSSYLDGISVSDDLDGNGYTASLVLTDSTHGVLTANLPGAGEISRSVELLYADTP